PKRFVVVPSTAQFDVPQIGCGILFFLATWSGPTIVAFAALNRALAAMDLQDLKLYVASIQFLTREFVAKYFPQVTFGGWGETFWIQNGQILRQLSRYDAAQAGMLEQYTRELLTAKRKANS